MIEYFWLNEAQVERLRPRFPKSRGIPRVDDRRVLSGIIYVLRNRLQWGMHRQSTASAKPSTTALSGGLASVFRSYLQ